MKKFLFTAFLALLTVLESCQKDEIDPTLPPIIETTESLDAENLVYQLVDEGRNIDFLVDLLDDTIWKACYQNGNSNNVYAYGIKARIIVDMKQKKVDKKLRNVITVWDGNTFNIYCESNYLAQIYNNGNNRFFKVTTNKSSKSTQCSTLEYYFTSAQSLGGYFAK